MRSYRIHSTVVIEEKAAKEKNKEILSRLKQSFYPLAAKQKKSVNNQKLLQGGEKREAEKLGGWEDGKLRSELHSISRQQPETNEYQHKRFAQHIGPPRRGVPGRRRQNHGG